jgi:hypothetical protein
LFLETQSNEILETEEDQALNEEKEDEMLKSRKFLFILSKLITYSCPPDQNDIYVIMMKIYIELSKIYF